MRALDRRIGIEIENESNVVTIAECLAYLNGTTASQRWSVESDGSLRGGTLAWEIKTRGGSGLEAGIVRSSMNELVPLLMENSGIWRAAVHTHVDVSDLSSVMLGKLMAALYCYDGAIFDRFSPHRVESNFCVPLFNITPHVISTVRSLYSGRQMAAIPWNKYSSCNFAAVRTFGTVEFRHMQTPAAGPSITSGRAAAEQIWRFAETVLTLVHIVASNPRASLPAVLTRIGTYLDTSVNRERAYTMISAIRGTAQDDITDADLGSLYSAALGRQVEVEAERIAPTIGSVRRSMISPDDEFRRALSHLENMIANRSTS